MRRSISVFLLPWIQTNYAVSALTEEWQTGWFARSLGELPSCSPVGLSLTLPPVAKNCTGVTLWALVRLSGPPPLWHTVPTPNPTLPCRWVSLIICWPFLPKTTLVLLHSHTSTEQGQTLTTCVHIGRRSYQNWVWTDGSSVNMRLLHCLLKTHLAWGWSLSSSIF